MKAGNLLDLDVREYNEVWELQRKLIALRAQKQIPDTLILVQHPHVFTVGKAVPGEIPDKIDGVPVVRIERGGQWTYHGPGQLIGYPILDLDTRNRNVHAFVYDLEEAIILTLREFGINAGRMEGRDKAGVWIGSRKIASIGAAIKNWVTYHGFAMNVNTDMKYFALIEPCGMPSSTMTSMSMILSKEVDLSIVKTSLLHNFESVFDLKCSSKRELDLIGTPTETRAQK